jgi:alpha-N-arabinofuranosidase
MKIISLKTVLAVGFLFVVMLLKAQNGNLAFDFHLANNSTKNGDISEFFLNGDQVQVQYANNSIQSRNTEYHVSIKGNDNNDGSALNPFLTISKAAQEAQSGDIITVHAGTYRERINPPRGGTSDSRRITYQAAPGEKVEIKGSEVVTNWVKVQADVWQAKLPNSFFGKFNPYSDLIHGDWFDDKGRKHHTGAVYLNEKWLTEAASLEDVMKSVGANPLWFGQVDEHNTTIWAQFKDVDPNQQLIEINARQTVFYPDQPGRNFITVRGFIMKDAATPWAPPTAEQIGLIGTNWSKGWIIENNTISHSICSGITLGKYGDEFDNKSANSADGYIKTIERALAFRIPWNRENIGHHIIRNNIISHCEQTGIVGSLGCAFSTITGNTIHDIHMKQLFTGWEMAGIKFHGAIDVEISHNHIYRTNRGLWLDWMAQGTRVSANLFHDNNLEDVYTEVNHGPFIFDNNVFLSTVNLWDMSEGGTYAHNLMTGIIITNPDRDRLTPFLLPHSTELAGSNQIAGGDHRFYNNIFIGDCGIGSEKGNNETLPVNRIYSPRGSGFGLCTYNGCDVPIFTSGNVYLSGASPYIHEISPLVLKEDFKIMLVEEGGLTYLQMNLPELLLKSKTKLVTSGLLNKAKIPGLGYENADGTSLIIGWDYFGKKNNPEHLSPGPFQNLAQVRLKLKVWPQ